MNGEAARSKEERERPGGGGARGPSEAGHGGLKRWARTGPPGSGQEAGPRTGAAGRRARAEGPRRTGAQRLRTSAEAGEQKMVPVSLSPTHSESTTLSGDRALGPSGSGSCQGSESQSQEHQSQDGPRRSIWAAGGGAFVSCPSVGVPVLRMQHRKALASELGERGTARTVVGLSCLEARRAAGMSKPWRYSAPSPFGSQG